MPFANGFADPPLADWIDEYPSGAIGRLLGIRGALGTGGKRWPTRSA
jgi:hypothetical protein